MLLVVSSAKLWHRLASTRKAPVMFKPLTYCQNRYQVSEDDKGWFVFIDCYAKARSFYVAT
ncbi:hypothetical protein D3C78_1843500 [compost metagenome]